MADLKILHNQYKFLVKKWMKNKTLKNWANLGTTTLYTVWKCIHFQIS